MYSFDSSSRDSRARAIEPSSKKNAALQNTIEPGMYTLFQLLEYHMYEKLRSWRSDISCVTISASNIITEFSFLSSFGLLDCCSSLRCHGVKNRLPVAQQPANA
jgi:hypothetical protein